MIAHSADLTKGSATITNGFVELTKHDCSFCGLTKKHLQLL